MEWGSFCLYTDTTKNIDKVARLDCVSQLFANVVNAALLFGGTVAIVMLIYGGLRMMLSGGEAKQAGAARQTITYAIVGLLVILLSFAILNFIVNITGVTCIKNFGFGNLPGECK